MKKNETCKWKFTDYCGMTDGQFITECEKVWHFWQIFDVLKFCPYCGGKIEEEK